MTASQRDVLDEADAARVDPDLVWRGLPAVVAIVAAVAGLPSYLVGVLVILALGAALERLVRRGRGGADSLLLGVGTVLGALVLGGAALRSTPLGSTTTTWGVGLGLVSLGCLALAANLPRPTVTSAAERFATPWALPRVVAAAATVSVVVIAAVAVGISARSVDSASAVGSSSGSGSADPGPAETRGAAPLRMSLGAVGRGQVRVKVSAPRRTGPVLLRTTDANGVEIDYPLFTVPVGATYSAVLEVAETGRYVISLVDPDRTTPLRSLVLDR